MLFLPGEQMAFRSGANLSGTGMGLVFAVGLEERLPFSLLIEKLEKRL